MNKHIGSNFDDFLEEEGLLEEAESVAIKRVIAYQLSELMKEQEINKVQMAEAMKTSRTQLNRLLDPFNTSVTLETIMKATKTLGAKVNITIEKTDHKDAAA